MTTDFSEWLETNKPILAKYAPDEMAHLAILVGFPVEVVCEGLSHVAMDILTRTRYLTREQYHVERELKHIDPGMEKQWREVRDYQQYGKEIL